MSSCYWAEPAQLHPWFKPATLKRKLPTMFLRSESPSPVDEFDSDIRTKRQRRITLEQTSFKKRKLPSPPQSPIEDVDIGDARLLKRQRCTTLERGIECLSLTPPAQQAVVAPHASDFVASQLVPPLSPIPVHTPDTPSSQWLEVTLPLSSPPAPSTSMSITPASLHTPTSTTPADTIADIKMHSSSWYEPEKDRTCLNSCQFLTHLFASR
jgi:hypothetical protein